MADRNIPELGFLIQEVEHKFGRKVISSADFESLSSSVQDVTKQVISVSTLKRIWGSVTLKPIPRISTLDILALYLGFDGYRMFYEDLIKQDLIESGFFETKCLSVSDLKDGDRVQITWAPNRLVTIKYLGDFCFEVIESVNSKLIVGDRFELSNIMVGYPLYISRILRDGHYTPSFIAGQTSGISTLKIC